MAKRTTKNIRKNAFGNFTGFLVNFFLGGNILSVLLLWICCGSTYLQPSEYPILAQMGLLFPVLLAANLLFLSFWLIFKPMMSLLPLIGMGACCTFVWDYCPFSVQLNRDENEASLLTVMTWNTGGLRWADDDCANRIVDYVAGSKTDVICLQEVGAEYSDPVVTLMDRMSVMGYYTATKGSGKVVFSKYPILSIDTLHVMTDSDEMCNGIMHCTLLISGDTVNVYNAHLESTRFTPEQKEEYANTLDSLDGHRILETSRFMLQNLRRASIVLENQVNVLISELDSAGSNIVCGDFNDTPISYAYQQVKKHLHSAYSDAGRGVGITFNLRGFYVRIDHLFSSDDWQTVTIKVDRSIEASDHFPLIVRLKKKKN